MKVYDRKNVASSLQYGILIETLREAFSSKITAPERVQHTIKNKNGSDATLLLMPAWKMGEHIGIKIVSVFPENTTQNMSAVHANYFLMNANNGKPIAIMDGTELTLRRTACASALAADYLAKKNADTLLMVGTGNLAPHMIKAHCVVRDYSRILIWGRNEEKAERLALSLDIKDKEIMAKNKEIPIIPANKNMHAAIKEMSKKKLGLVCCREKNGKINILTDGDLRRHSNNLHKKKILKVACTYFAINCIFL